VNELRRDLQTVATAQAQAAGQISTLTSTVTTRLDAVSRSLTDGVGKIGGYFRAGPDSHARGIEEHAKHDGEDSQTTGGISGSQPRAQ
jgi:hypothetical protein